VKWQNGDAGKFSKSLCRAANLAQTGKESENVAGSFGKNVAYGTCDGFVKGHLSATRTIPYIDRK